jgi:hypothetical protein
MSESRLCWYEWAVAAGSVIVNGTTCWLIMVVQGGVGGVEYNMSKSDMLQNSGHLKCSNRQQLRLSNGIQQWPDMEDRLAAQ